MEEGQVATYASFFLFFFFFFLRKVNAEMRLPILMDPLRFFFQNVGWKMLKVHYELVQNFIEVGIGSKI